MRSLVKARVDIFIIGSLVLDTSCRWCRASRMIRRRVALRVR